MTTTFKPGDVVAYSATFLRNIGCHTGPLPWARGEVQSVNDWGVAHVRWDHPDVPATVHTRALILAGEIYREPC